MRKVLVARHMARCMGCVSCMLACARRVRHSLSVSKAAIRIRTKGGFSSGLMAAHHCRGCDEPPCLPRCPAGALKKRAGGGILLNQSLCDGCGICVAACPVNAIYWDSDTKQPIFCIHCGNCAKFCPHGCLVVEEVI